jgi:hypothetical protein
VHVLRFVHVVAYNGSQTLKISGFPCTGLDIHIFSVLILGSPSPVHLLLCRLSDAARAGVEKMWSEWGNSANPSLKPAVCPLVLHAGTGLKAGIVAHFGGSHLN